MYIENLHSNILMLKKGHPELCICIVIRGSLTGQRHVDDVLHPHVLQIYQIVGKSIEDIVYSQEMYHLDSNIIKRILFESLLWNTPLLNAVANMARGVSMRQVTDILYYTVLQEELTI